MTMPKLYVFYAGLLHSEYASHDSFRALQVHCDMELYNGGYIYVIGDRWYRMDGTPVLDVDVPINLKTMLLLLS